MPLYRYIGTYLLCMYIIPIKYKRKFLYIEKIVRLIVVIVILV